MPWYSIEWIQHENENFMITKAPVWFNPNAHVSLSACVVFFLEISLWVHYNAYVRGTYKATQGKDELNPKLFLKKEGNLINIKNDLGEFWDSIQEKNEKNINLM
jgi:hypothetical protein